MAETRRADEGGTRRAPARASDVFSVEIAGETLLYRVASGAVHRLDRIGSVVWRFLDGETMVDDLVNDLAAAFGVDPATVQADVDELLEGLERACLLAGEPSPEQRIEPARLTNPPGP